MSTTTTDAEGWTTIQWPDDPADYTPEDHLIVATSYATSAIENYWESMDARPAMAEFKLKVADMLLSLMRQENGLPDVH